MNFQGIEFPVFLNDIKKYEKLNNISVNVYAYDSSHYPLRITKNKLKKSCKLVLCKRQLLFD